MTFHHHGFGPFSNTQVPTNGTMTLNCIQYIVEPVNICQAQPYWHRCCASIMGKVFNIPLLITSCILRELQMHAFRLRIGVISRKGQSLDIVTSVMRNRIILFFRAKYQQGSSVRTKKPVLVVTCQRYAPAVIAVLFSESLLADSVSITIVLQ